MPLAGDRVKASDLDFPISQLRATTATSLTAAVATSVAFATEDYDDDNMHDTVTNNTRLTARRAGRYEINGAVAFTFNATGRRAVQYGLNGLPINGSQTLIQAVTTGSGVTQVTGRQLYVTLAIGDYVELMGFQDSGGALLTAVGGVNQSTLLARYLGPG